jgi:hypothetical protein
MRERETARQRDSQEDKENVRECQGMGWDGIGWGDEGRGVDIYTHSEQYEK